MLQRGGSPADAAGEASVQALLTALRFLTRLPVGRASPELPPLGRVSAMFPVVGASVGALVALVVYGAGLVLPLPVAAGLGIAAWLGITGGLHIDGLADLCDAAAALRHQPARALEIMRDPRSGAHGVAGVVVLVVLKWSALGQCGAREAWLAPVAAAVSGRLAVVWMIRSFPYARANGLGKGFHDQTRTVHALIATLLGAGVSVGVLCAFGWAPWPSWALAMTAGLVVGLALGAWVSPRLGGLTGDVYGAAVELAETAALVVWLLG